MPLNEIPRHAEQVDFGLVAVTDDSAVHVRRGTRHLSQPMTNQSSGAGFRERERALVLQEEFPDHFFHRFGALRENPFLQTSTDRLGEGS